MSKDRITEIEERDWLTEDPQPVTQHLIENADTWPLGSYSLQRSGSSGFALGFPIEATRKNDLEVGDKIEVYGLQDGSLLLTPQD